jgi:hypothetical protein
MPLVSKPFSFACRAERLARTGSCPDWSIVGPSCLPQGIAPDPDPSEEVALSVSHKLDWPYIFNAPFVDVTRGNVARGDQVAKPLRGDGINLVVVRRRLHIDEHSTTYTRSQSARASFSNVMAE